MVDRVVPTLTETLEDLIRNEVRDPLLDRAGNAHLQTRYTPTAVTVALRHAVMYLQRELRLVNAQEAYVYADGTYTSQALSSALPAGVGAFDPVAKVECIVDPLRPAIIPSVPFAEIERYAVSTTHLPQIQRGYPYRMVLTDGPNPGERHLQIRPRPTGDLAIRVWYIRPPLEYAAGESQAMASHWEDLLILLAAKELVGRLEGMSSDQQERLSMILGQFRAAGNRPRQPQRITRKRIGRS